MHGIDDLVREQLRHSFDDPLPRPFFTTPRSSILFRSSFNNVPVRLSITVGRPRLAYLLDGPLRRPTRQSSRDDPVDPPTRFQGCIGDETYFPEPPTDHLR